MAGRRKKLPAAPAAAVVTAPPAPLEVVGAPARAERCADLVVRAELAGRIALPGGPLALDALLGWAACARAGVLPPMFVHELRPMAIPVLRDPSDRFYLASFAVGAFERFGVKWINRRFPVAEAQAMAAPGFRRILITGGPCKSYRIPLEAGHLEGDALTWYMVGEQDRIADLLTEVRYLGKRRGVGLGRVVRWSVEPCDRWGDGFPVVSPEGRALRTLPEDHPGLVAPEIGYRVLDPPYWRREAEQPCAVAAW